MQSTFTVCSTLWMLCTMQNFIVLLMSVLLAAEHIQSMQAITEAGHGHFSTAHTVDMQVLHADLRSLILLAFNALLRTIKCFRLPQKYKRT